MGGTIGLNSQPGQGSTFLVSAAIRGSDTHARVCRHGPRHRRSRARGVCAALGAAAVAGRGLVMNQQVALGMLDDWATRGPGYGRASGA